MEKILFVTDVVSMSNSCLDFACFLANLTQSKITGVFLENQSMELRSAAEIHERGVTAPIPGVRLEEQKELYRDENIRRFHQCCTGSGINSVVHQHTGMPLKAVLKESRYADLIVIDAATTFSWRPETAPTGFVRDILEKAECPVIIAPENFKSVHEIILTYNGSGASVFAIKQFTYLLPQLHDHKVTLLSVTPPGKPLQDDVEKLKEWLHAHYNDVSIEIAEDDNVEARLMEYLSGRENVMIVMGAFGRSLLSNLFAPNPMKSVIQLITQPMFIAHP
ncbi:universal stress protein [Chitinophaga flava]|uniref:UspA domain-containing protein n=1 Tax=Chitinophaga flava TaxID=2259036 RepID=A0A365Y0P1_9BACT|nr:universal stress protein [Chitinophaga flava]RBL91405.1 hypothetical protein DF182_01940 [Chitinophaga flava]